MSEEALLAFERALEAIVASLKESSEQEVIVEPDHSPELQAFVEDVSHSSTALLPDIEF